MSLPVPVSVLVSVVAGGINGLNDGIGAAAQFNAPRMIAYSAARGNELLITEPNLNRIQCVYPASDSRKAALQKVLNLVLVEGSAIPIQPLLSIIIEFLLADSTAVFSVSAAADRFELTLFRSDRDRFGDYDRWDGCK